MSYGDGGNRTIQWAGGSTRVRDQAVVTVAGVLLGVRGTSQEYNNVKGYKVPTRAGGWKGHHRKGPQDWVLIKSVVGGGGEFVAKGRWSAGARQIDPLPSKRWS